MLELFSLGIAVYLGLLLFIFIGVSKSNTPNPNPLPIAVSIVVAARNEEQHIATCLENLLQQTYPQKQLEIIIVDDRSQDATGEIVQSYANAYPNIRLIKIDNSEPKQNSQALLVSEKNDFQQFTINQSRLPAKKYALTQGIIASKGEIVFITDADCVVPDCWVEEMLQYFDSQTGLVVGPLAIRTSKPRLLQRLIEIENYFKVILTKAGIENNFPLTAQGGSLAFRRELFHALGGFASIAHSVSGDDDLWLHQVHNKTSWKIHFASSPKIWVTTTPPANWREFWRQHLRHFSASRYYPWQAKLFYFGWHVSNLMLFLSPPVAVLWFPHFFLYTLLLLGVKLGADVFLIWQGAQVLNFKFDLKYFIPFELFYLFDNIVIGTLAHLVKITWKG